MQNSYPHRDSIRRFVDCLEIRNPLLVILFGSVATGDFTSDSDADVLTVFADCPDWAEIYRCSDGWVQPFVLSLVELKGRLTNGDGFIHEIMDDGLLLCGSPGLWEELRRLAGQTRLDLGMARLAAGWSYQPNRALSDSSKKRDSRMGRGFSPKTPD